jgi:ParB/RepB/Spo0J family partition protein
MTEETVISSDMVMLPSRVFAVADEQGEFAECDTELLPGPDGMTVRIALVEQADGWRSGVVAELPNQSLSKPLNAYVDPHPSRAHALIAALGDIIVWASQQQTTGKSGHRKRAAELVKWAEERREGAMPAIQADDPGACGTLTETEPLHARTNSEPGIIATAEALPASLGDVQWLPIGDIHESPLNPRQYYPEGPLNELAESMRASGFRVWQPIIGRPWPGGGCEIGAGHRRRRAALRAGLFYAPCIVREMTDEEFLDLLNFDNAGREDVHPLHEAAGWQRLIDTGKWSVQSIAARRGKSQEYVYKRLKVASMIEPAKVAYLDGKITLGHAELIARCPERDQPRALAACEVPEWNPGAERISTRELAAWIKKNLQLDLAKAPFPLASAELLPSAGSCDACPHRVGNLPDFNPLEDIASACMQPACYEQKIAAHIEAEKLRLQSELGYLICVSERNNPTMQGALPHSEWHRVPMHSDGKGAKTALMIDGSLAGHTLQVLIRERLPIEAPPEPKPTAPAPSASSPDPKLAEQQKREREREAARLKALEAKQKREREEAERKLACEASVRQKLLKAILDKVTWPPSRDGLIRLLEDWIGEMAAALDEIVEGQGVRIRGESNWPKVSDQQLARLVAIVAVCDDFTDFNLRHSAKGLDAAAKRHGVDSGSVRKRATLEYEAQASGIDWSANKIECKPGKNVLADIRFGGSAGHWTVTVGISLPVKGNEGYGESGPANPKTGEHWTDRGEAHDAAFARMVKFLGTVDNYKSATDSTRAAAAQVREWVEAGQAARAAIRELVALDKPAVEKTRVGVIGKLPTLAGPAKTAAGKPAAKKAPVKKSAPKKGKGKK